MHAILGQLGIDATLFYQLAIFAVLFVLLEALYFKPFLNLFQARHEKTIRDREAAERLMQDASAKLEEYKRKLGEERLKARGEYEEILMRAKHEEAELLAGAREEAKRIAQQAAESVAEQRLRLRAQLEADVESLAHGVSERLLSGKG